MTDRTISARQFRRVVKRSVEDQIIDIIAKREKKIGNSVLNNLVSCNTQESDLKNSEDDCFSEDFPESDNEGTLFSESDAEIDSQECANEMKEDEVLNSS
ncbi:unnamed protein product, partial [Allacma fusca]